MALKALRSPTDGVALGVAKRVAEQLLWTRVAVQVRLPGGPPAPPPAVDPTAVLGTRAEWESAAKEARRRRLPLHHDRQKNWDALGAVSTVLAEAGGAGSVLDAGSARYSPILPWLRLYGLTDLIGINLEFDRTFRHGPVTFAHGDITATGFPDDRFDAVTCMSVIEHGVPTGPFLAETARILRPGGVLVLSTDYDQTPPDTTGLTAYGTPVRIFGPGEIQALVDEAAGSGLRLRGQLALTHPERPVHWERTGLDYTFIRLTFDRER